MQRMDGCMQLLTLVTNWLYKQSRMFFWYQCICALSASFLFTRLTRNQYQHHPLLRHRPAAACQRVEWAGLHLLTHILLTQ